MCIRDSINTTLIAFPGRPQSQKVKNVLKFNTTTKQGSVFVANVSYPKESSASKPYLVRGIYVREAFSLGRRGGVEGAGVYGAEPGPQ